MKKSEYKKIDTVPNQRVITIHKEPTNRDNFYATLNLEALSEAVKDLQSQRGIKLYLYLAKNQSEYKTALSSSDFCEWAKCGMTEYNSAFKELEEKGYLINVAGTNTIYTFYDKAREKADTTEIKEAQAIEAKKEIELYTPKIEEVTISPECLSGYSKKQELPKRPDKKNFVF